MSNVGLHILLNSILGVNGYEVGRFGQGRALAIGREREVA
jgi:hypothetical protein